MSMSARIPKTTVCEVAKRAFAAMMGVKQIDVAAIEAAVHADA